MAADALDVSPSARRSPGVALRWLGSPPGWVALAVTASFAVTVWWLLNDTRVPSWDPGAHMYRALQYADAFRAGDLTEWFSSYQTPGYPPLVYVVGAFTALIFGEGVRQFVIVEALIFLPLLGLGTYQAGKLAYGARTGALAAIFVLGSPLVITQSHVFMLDMPQTAVTAIALWLLLACRRFERDGVAFAAGVVFGCGMLTKNIFSLMLLGLLAVMVLRGGWRNPKGIVLFAVGVAITGLPWYIAHFDGLLQYAMGGTVSGAESLYGADPPRWSLADWEWYLWAATNIQYYLPLWLLGVAGVGWALVRVVRVRPWASDDVTPELLGGLFVGIVLTVALTHNDVRYTMPLVLYVGILGCAWFATSKRGWLRTAGAVVVAVLFALNLISTSTGDGIDWRITVPGTWTSGDGAGTATVFSTQGWLVGSPSHGGDVQASLEAAKRQGARYVVIDRIKAGTSEFNVTGLGMLTRFAGLEVAPDNDYGALGARDIYITSGESQAQPCGHAADGTPIYFERGGDVQPVDSADNLVCPPRSPDTYAAPGRAHPSPAAQEILDKELRAAQKQGITSVYFQEPVATTPLLGGSGQLRADAQDAGLDEPRDGRLSNLSADGMMVLYAPNYDAVAKMACAKLPDGGALIFTRGPLTTLTLEYAQNLYCPTRSPDVFSGPGEG